MPNPAEAGTSEGFALSGVGGPGNAGEPRLDFKVPLGRSTTAHGQAPMAIAPPSSARRPSFTFLLCCDRCQAEPACILSFNDRQLLCKSCDVAVHAGKSELEAPRFQINAKCLPKLASPVPENSPPGAAMRPGSVSSLPTPPKAMLEPEDLLMDLQGPQPAPDGQLIDFDWWPGPLGLLEANQSKNSAASSACQAGQQPPPPPPPLFGAMDVAMPQICVAAGPEAQDGCAIFSPEAPQSPVSQGSDFSGQSSCCQRVEMCCSTGDRCLPISAAPAPLLQPLGHALLDSSHAADQPGESFVRACVHCGVTKTPQWRAGPLGQKTLCNACGVRFKAGRLTPAASHPPPGFPAGAALALSALQEPSAGKRATAPGKQPGAPKRKLQLGGRSVQPSAPSITNKKAKAKYVVA